MPEEEKYEEEKKEEDPVKRTRIDKVLPGMVVAEDIKDGNDNSLLGANSELTEMTIKALFEKEILYLPIVTASYEKIKKESKVDKVVGVEFSEEDIISMGEDAAREFLADEEQRAEDLPQELRNFYMRLRRLAEDNYKAIKNKEEINIHKNRLLFVVLRGFFKESASETMNLLRYRSRENYLYSQAVNSTILALYLAEKMGLERQKCMDIGLGTMLHDLGMMEFEKICQKEGAFTEAEKTMLKSHPRICETEISKTKGLSPEAASIIFEHHERLDGSGDPKGLEFGEISELSAIAMVAIEFIELFQPRILAERINASNALAKIKAKSGGAFWEEPVEKLEEIVKEDFRLYSPGTLIELGAGEIGVVLAMTEIDSKPILNLVVDSKGKPIEEPEKISLKEKTDKYIKSIVHDNIILVR